jgi:hypothetical protein
MHVERRREARHLFLAVAEITEPRSRYAVSTRTNDISPSGCYVDMLNPLAAGAELHVRIVHRGEVVDVPARVVHSQVNMGMGICFTPTDTLQTRVLGQWLEGNDAA